MNQEKLQSMSLKDASTFISDLLIAESVKLLEYRKQLADDKKQYEEDYVIANAHGDARENAQLDEAKQNLRLITGEIASNAKLLNALKGLEDVRYLKSTFDFRALFDTIKLFSELEYEEINKFIPLDNIKDFLIGVKYNELNSIINKIEEESTDSDNIGYFLSKLDEFLPIVKKPEYNSFGLVKLYSTVKVECEGKVYVFKIYPKGVSFVAIGIIAADSKLAISLLDMAVGSVAYVQHASLNKRLEYKILDIY